MHKKLGNLFGGTSKHHWLVFISLLSWFFLDKTRGLENWKFSASGLQWLLLRFLLASQIGKYFLLMQGLLLCFIPLIKDCS